MSNTVLIIGNPGSGKSSSIRTLNPKETFILSVLNKPLPFKGYKKNYIPITSWDDREGNYLITDDWQKIIKCIKLINDRPEIKSLIIDDFNYIMCSEFMKRSSEQGYNKYTDMALHTFLIVQELMNSRSDLFNFVFAHSEIDNTGFSKIKTIGKLLEEKISLEGMFTTCLHAQIIDGRHRFLTQNNGTHLAKSPMGLFSEMYIENDLDQIKESMILYFED